LPHVSLTERESEVLLRVAKGFTLPEIGVQLGLSRHTIADYVKQIYRKLNVSRAPKPRWKRSAWACSGANGPTPGAGPMIRRQ
jgi:DNA-binding NarL/FixJ family response regulator